jgi:hypothetical protein
MAIFFAAVLLLTSRISFAAGAWTLVWEDNFDSGINSSTWNVAANVSEGSNQIELYTADNVYTEFDSVHNVSALVVRTQLANVTSGGKKYNVTSGRLDTMYKRNFTAPARVEVSARLQVDALSSGVHTAHWLLGYDCWPRGAEIDIMECQSPGNVYANSCPSGLYQKATSNYHYGTTCGAEIRHSTGTSFWPHAATPTIDYSSYYSVFAVEWNATDILVFVNSTLVNHVYAGMPGWAGPFQIPTWDTYLIVSQAYMAARPCGEAKDWPVYQFIDYVRAYSWAA